MKSSIISFVVVLTTSTNSLARGPEYGAATETWPSCASSCSSTSTSSSFCSNSTQISNTNSYVAGSSCSDSDKSTVYSNIAQLFTDAGVQVTASPEATFSATSNSAYAGSPFNGRWGGSGDGYGPFGGAWGPWGSSGPWTSGAWTTWWDDSACPGDTWPGWTSGAWSSDAPWTTWTTCTATTTASSIYTTKSSGSVVTGTSFGVKVAEETGSSSSGAVSTTTNAGGAGNNVAKVALGFVVVTFVVIVQG